MWSLQIKAELAEVCTLGEITPFQKPAAIAFKGDSSTQGKHDSFADRSDICKWMHVWRWGPAGPQVRALEVWLNTGPLPSTAAVRLRYTPPRFLTSNSKSEVVSPCWSLQHIISSLSDTVTYLSWLHRNSWKAGKPALILVQQNAQQRCWIYFTSSHKLLKNFGEAYSLQTHMHN